MGIHYACTRPPNLLNLSSLGITSNRRHATLHTLPKSLNPVLQLYVRIRTLDPLALFLNDFINLFNSFQSFFLMRYSAAILPHVIHGNAFLTYLSICPFEVCITYSYFEGVNAKITDQGKSAKMYFLTSKYNIASELSIVLAILFCRSSVPPDTLSLFRYYNTASKFVSRIEPGTKI